MEFDYTNHNYTRFGAWSKAIRTHAAADPSPPDTGVFAYSPLDPSTASVDELKFSAIYEGGTIAVDSEGSIYKGFIQLTVEWDPDSENAVTSFIRDLKNVSDNSWFQYASEDVGYIFFEEMTAVPSGVSGASASARIRYRDGNFPEVAINGTQQMSGKFLGKSIDGPLGVIGSWSIVESANNIDIQGAFGAELLP